MRHVRSAFYGNPRTRMLERPIRMKAPDDAGWLCLTKRHRPQRLEQKHVGKTTFALSGALENVCRRLDTS